MDEIEYKGFEAMISFNEHNGMYTAHAKGIANWHIYAESAGYPEIIEDFKDAVDRYLQCYEVSLSVMRN